MQVDFTHIRRGRDSLLAFVATLGYSRASWVCFTSNERADTCAPVLSGHLDILVAFPSTSCLIMLERLWSSGMPMEKGE
jgi:hypothetical protein